MVVDGGMVTLDVLEKAGPDVRCQVADPGIILSRANLTFRRNGVIVRARNSMLPVLSSKVGILVLRAELLLQDGKLLVQDANWQLLHCVHLLISHLQALHAFHDNHMSLQVQSLADVCWMYGRHVASPKLADDGLARLRFTFAC